MTKIFLAIFSFFTTLAATSSAPVSTAGRPPIAMASHPELRALEELARTLYREAHGQKPPKGVTIQIRDTDGRLLSTVQ